MKKIYILLLLTISFSLTYALDTEQLDKHLDELSEKNKAMGAVALSKGGEMFYYKGYGVENIKSGKKITEGSLFRIGSISKTYNAVLILQLIENGKLSFDTKLSEYYPEIANAENITIKQMLLHQSGIHNFTNDDDYYDFHEKKQSKKQMLKRFKKLKPDFVEGESLSYSNTAYVILAFIIEDIYQDNYASIFKRQIADKIGLKNTYAGGDFNPETECMSYSFGNGEWVESTITDNSVTLGAGSVIATPQDVNKFYYSLFTGKLISDKMLERMIDFERNFGMGIVTFPYYGKTAYGHTGGIDGFSSMSGYFQDDSISITIVNNAYNYNTNEIILAALNTYYGKEHEFPVLTDEHTIKDISILKKYVGFYKSKTLALAIDILEEDGVLKIFPKGQGIMAMKAISDREFTLEQADLKITFIEKDGQYDFKMNQHGMEYYYKKSKK